MNHKLINFNVPKDLLERFDCIARTKHVSRTSLLNILIDQYCRSELNSLDLKNVEKRNVNPHLAPVDFYGSGYDPFQGEF